MDLIERQLCLLDTLLCSAIQSARDPEAFKLYFGVFLKDMVHTAGSRTGRDWETRVYFSCVLCRDGEVLAAAIPGLLSEEGVKQQPLFPRQLAALRRAGIPLFSDLLVKERGEDGAPEMELKSLDCPGPSGWRFPTVPVPPELGGLLCKKGMVSGGDSKPTGYGNQLGLCETRWYGGKPVRLAAGLYCSAAGWVNRVRLGEHPWGDGPDWAPLPLDIRLERMRTGRAGNPGHCMSALLRLEAMPVAPLLSECLNKAYIEENRSELQALYGPCVTYGQAARNAARLMDSKSKKERETGESILNCLAVLFRYCYKRRKSPRTFQNGGESIPINDPVQTGGRSLSARLSGAGILDSSGSALPLMGDHLEDVFEGLSRLTGTGALAQEFYLTTPFRLWKELEGKWDGSLDGLICHLWALNSGETGQVNSEVEIMRAFRRLLVEPFCLLEEIRGLEEEHGALQEKIRKENETLKKELERMNF